MLIILDKTQVGVGAIQNFRDRYTRGLNSNFDFIEFECLPHKELVNDNYIVYENKLFIIKEVSEEHTDKQLTYVYAEQSAVGELLGSITRPQVFNGQTPTQILKVFLQSTDWEIGLVESTELIDFDVDYQTTLKSVLDLAEKANLEIEYAVEMEGLNIKSKKINLLKERGTRILKHFEYGVNMGKVKRKKSNKDTITSIIGRGKNGLTIQGGIDLPHLIPKGYTHQADFIYNNEALSNKGRHIFKFIKTEASTKAKLIEEMLKALDENLKEELSYECSVDFFFNELNETPNVGDTIIVRDLSFSPPLLVEARIQEIVSSKSNPEEDSVKIGNYKELKVNDWSELQSVKDKLNENIENWNIIEKAQDELKQDITGINKEQEVIRDKQDDIIKEQETIKDKQDEIVKEQEQQSQTLKEINDKVLAQREDFEKEVVEIENNLNNKTDKLQEQITNNKEVAQQKSAELDSKVQTLETTKTNISDFNQLKDNFDNLEIGGRNLVLDSGINKDTKLFSWAGSKTSVVDDSACFSNSLATEENASKRDGYIDLDSSIDLNKNMDNDLGDTVTTFMDAIFRQSSVTRTGGGIATWIEHTIAKNTEYTLSFEAKSTDPTFVLNYIHLMHNDGTANRSIQYSTKLTKEFKHYYITFKLNTDLKKFRVMIAGVGNQLCFKNLKLEKGNKATDWTPAPEDVDGRITEINTEIKNINGELSTKVNQKDYNVDKKGMLTSIDEHTTQITQNSKDIASKASQHTVDGLTGRVSNAESSITQNANSIKTKVDNTVYQQDKKGITTSIESANTKIEQNATDIKTKASTATVNTLTGRVNTAESTISQQAGLIASKVDSAAYTKDKAGIIKDVELANTAIEQNANEIKTKASTASVNTLTGRMNTAESSILQNANEIKTKVSSTQVNEMIEGIEIGGRNLIKNSHIVPSFITTPTSFNGTKEYLGEYKGKQNVWRITKPPSYFAYNIGVRDRPKLEVGNEYTYSIEVLCEGNPSEESKIYLSASSGDYRPLNEEMNIGEWNRLSITTKTITKEEVVTTPHFRFIGYDVIYVSFFPKLEKGNKATDWTPAPEDTINSISELETSITQTNKEIALKANKTDLDNLTGRVGKAESSITLNTDNIKLKVDNTAFNKQTQEFKSDISKIDQKADSISSTVSSNKIEQDGKITSMQSSITQQGNLISQKVSKGDVVSEINQSPTTVNIKASKINFDGHVFGHNATFTGDISGANISGSTFNSVSDSGDEFVTIENGRVKTEYYDRGARTTFTSTLSGNGLGVGDSLSSVLYGNSGIDSDSSFSVNADFDLNLRSGHGNINMAHQSVNLSNANVDVSNTTYSGEPVSASRETGFCGVGGFGEQGIKTLAGVGVNFRVRRKTTPSSVYLSEYTGGKNTEPETTGLNRDGFWLYIKQPTAKGYYYWRGEYRVN